MLADDHDLFRSEIRDALEEHGFLVVAEAADASEAVAAALRHRPEVCLLDVDMPGGGVSAAGRIRTRLPDTKVAMLSGSGRDDELFAAIRAGADGYLPKSTTPDRLGIALTALLHGEAALPRELTIRLVTELRKPGLVSNPKKTIGWRILYVPRLMRHFIRRLRSGMGLSHALESARDRVAQYM